MSPLPVDEALARILARCRLRTSETVALERCRGRVLAADIVSDLDLPPFDNSAMDGFAVHLADVAGASEDSPVVLPVHETIAAAPGEPAPLPAGYASRIMTGAPWPAGAEAVVPVELTRSEGEGRVAVLAVPKPDANRRPRGEDLRRGETVVPAGRTLAHAELALLAAVGAARVEVARRPTAVVVSTGDELVDVAATPGPGQIRDSAVHALPAQLAAAGAQVVGIYHAVDSPSALETLFQSLSDVDLVVTSGGVSMGDRDFVRPTFERLGEVDFWRVAVKPGKPLLFGTLGAALFFGLPGNPVSSMVTFDIFVRPAIDRMLGRTDGGRVAFDAILEEALRSDAKRAEYVRVTAAPGEDGRWRARATGAQSSGRMTSMLGANAYAVVPVGVGELAAGERVRVELHDPGPGVASE